MVDKNLFGRDTEISKRVDLPIFILIFGRDAGVAVNAHAISSGHSENYLRNKKSVRLTRIELNDLTAANFLSEDLGEILIPVEID